MRYAAGVDERGQPIDVRDPLAATLAEIAAGAAGDPDRLDPDRLADGLLGLTAVFGTDLPADPRFTDPTRAALRRLYAEGARAVIAAP
jgi:fructuronate reductase